VLQGLAILAVRWFLHPCPSRITLITELISYLGPDMEALTVHSLSVCWKNSGTVLAKLGADTDIRLSDGIFE